MHGRLHTERHSIGRRAISTSPARRSASAANSPAPSGPSIRLAGDADEKGRGGRSGALRVHGRASGRAGCRPHHRLSGGPRHPLRRASWGRIRRRPRRFPPRRFKAQGRGQPWPSRAASNHWRGGGGTLRRGIAGGLRVTILAGHRRSLAAPPAASRNSRAHGRSPGSRRIAGAAFPDFHQVQWRKKRRHAAHSRGGGHGSAEAYRVPFSPSGKIEGPCAVLFQLRGGLSNDRQSRDETRLWLHARHPLLGHSAGPSDRSDRLPRPRRHRRRLLRYRKAHRARSRPRRGVFLPVIDGNGLKEPQRKSMRFSLRPFYGVPDRPRRRNIGYAGMPATLPRRE